MNLNQNRASICRLGCFALLLTGCLTAAGQAEQPFVYKIEEDWELVVGTPRAAIYCPQISFYTTPDSQSPDIYFELQLNYAAREDFTGGGFMVSAVRNEVAVQEARSDVREPLTQQGEQLRWTSVMAVINNELLFAIKDGLGSQWGEFGGPEYIVRMPAKNVQSLDRYVPQNSLDNIDISFGANRVDSLVLTKARLFYSDDQTVEITINNNP